MKLSRFGELLFLSFCLWALAPRISAQAPPGYTLLYQENFDGNHVNEQDWRYRIDHRTAGTWVDGYDRKENVSVHDGALHISVRKEKIDGKDEFTGGGLISKHQFGYGYYECLSRPFMAGKGVHSAFWEAGGAVPNNDVFEIDSYEIDSTTFMTTHNLYMHLRPASGKEEPWPMRSSEPWSFRRDGWYLSAFEYTPDGITFYDNGKVAAHAEFKDLTAAQTVLLTALNGISKVDETRQPGETVFKYFRYYARDYPGINILPNGDFEYNQQSGVSVAPISWQQQGTADSSYVSTGNAIHGKYFLRQGNEKIPYAVTASQSLEYILNGDYTLTAMVRSSGGQALAQIQASGFGGSDIAVDIPVTSTWKQISIPHIPVANHSIRIAVTSKGTPAQWLEVDNIQFMKPPLPGQRPRDPKPFVFRSEPIWTVAQQYPLHFVGDDSFVMFSRNVGLGDAISVTFLMNPDREVNTSPIAREPQTGPSGWAFLLTDRGEIVFRIGSKQNHQDVVAPHAYKAREDQRVIGIFDHGVASIYVNGKLLARQTGITADTNDTSTPGKIGNVGNDYEAVGDITLKTTAGGSLLRRFTRFTGTIADVRVFNRAMSDQEIANLDSASRPE